MSDHYPFRVHAESMNALVILDVSDEVICYFINTQTATTSEDRERADLVCTLLNRYHHQQNTDAPWAVPIEEGEDDSDDTDEWNPAQDNPGG